MRLYELLEGLQNKFQADLNCLLLTLKASNIQEIPTPMLVRKINDLGYSITVNNLVNIAKDYPMIASADGQQVSIAGDDQPQDDGSIDSEIEDREMTDGEADEMTVNDMAKKGMQQ